MAIGWVLLSLGLLAAGLLLPGYLLARRFCRPRGLVEEAVYATGLGLFLVPASTFAVAWGLGLPFRLPLLLAVAAALSLAAVPWRLPARVRAGDRRAEILVLIALVGFAVVLLQWTDLRAVRAFRFLECCLHSVASYLQLGSDTTFALFDPWSGGDVTYILAHPTEPVFGLRLWSFEQRPLNGAIVATVMLLTGSAGIEVLSLLVFFVVGGTATIIAGRYLRQPLSRLLVGLGTPLALHGLIGYMVNESTFLLAASMLLLALLLRGKADAARLFLAGVLLGCAFGARAAGLFLLLPLALWIPRASAVGTRRGLLAAGAGFLLAALPWFVAYAILRGNPLFHTVETLEIPHEFLGMEFRFRPLNWPFFDHFVRPPSDVLPTMFYVPVKVLLSAGSLVVAAALVGFARLPRRGGLSSDLALAVAWAGPFTLLMLFLADMDHERITWLLVVMPVLPLALARFGASLATGRRRAMTVAVWVLLAASLGFLPRLAVSVEVPEDPRNLPWYIVDGDAFNASTMEETREELGRLAFLPSGQEVATRSRLIRTLSRQAETDVARSGRTFVRLDGHGTTRVSFPMHVDEAPPPLPEPIDFAPGDLIQFANQYVLVHVRVTISAEPTVYVTGSPAELRVAIDPGEGPRTERTLSLLIDEQMSDDLPWGESARVVISVGSVPVPTRAVGWIVEKGGVETTYPALVTNYRLPEAPEVSGTFPCGDKRCTYRWSSLPTGTPPPDPQAPLLPLEAPACW